MYLRILITGFNRQTWKPKDAEEVQVVLAPTPDKRIGYCKTIHHSRFHSSSFSAQGFSISDFTKGEFQRLATITVSTPYVG